MDGPRRRVRAIFLAQRDCFAIVSANRKHNRCAKRSYSTKRNRGQCGRAVRQTARASGSNAADRVQPPATRRHAENAVPILPHDFAIGRCAPDPARNFLHAMPSDDRRHESRNSKACGVRQNQHADSVDTRLPTAFFCELQPSDPFAARCDMSGMPRKCSGASSRVQGKRHIDAHLHCLPHHKKSQHRLQHMSFADSVDSLWP